MSGKNRLEQLKKQKAALEARIQAAEAREKTIEKKRDTRRKILIGAYYLDKATKEKSMPEIAKLLDGYLTRDNDRLLFNLPSKEGKKK